MLPTSHAPETFDYLIVGAGFAGCVLAERLASQLGLRVLLIDRRDHLGGNAYDCTDAAGVLVHRYGPHIFHTNAQKVVDYLSQFTRWRPYQHRVLADVQGQQLPMPINLTTINRLYGLSLDSAGAAAFLAARATALPELRSSRDVVVSQVGEELYRTFFEGYTRKQWGRDATELDKSVTARVPTRTDADDRYFQDRFQCMPLEGYTRMFERMVDHPNIRFLPDTDHAELGGTVRWRHLVYTGPVDEFFGYCFGPLPYRSLRFEHRTLDQEWLQPVAVVNYPAPEVPYTRITEYKHLTGQRHPRTSITHEYPTDQGDPYYPIPAPENAALYERYAQLAEQTPGVTFTGRLGTYRYYNMDQVVAQSLALFARIAQTAPAASGVRAPQALRPSLLPPQLPAVAGG
ncbi:UDP-galactopyranose mutase [Pseudorhodoferax aquiterrae]|uniref:UDP-galactopyranose mutase n=1 Tax=Pseudorhodoferax aquiterrae TaxID=747304 RepID=A0ABQ3G5N7_9BURK|nr:UDP-galactopyranose mutase [Pseudorhodoferax aquiterrae]GHC91938.1 UDP-galactopyranose mutase [Pseudorhodoferax aquiterrae]